MKAIKILSFVIIGILVVGIGIGAYIYFYTDTFKTNKEIFYKYAKKEQITQLLDAESIKQTITRLKNETSEQNIEININASMDEQNVLNNATILAKNKTNPKEDKYEINLTFGNANKTDILEMNGVYDKERFGIFFKEITQRYIAVENKNLDEFFKKIGITNFNTEDIKISNYTNQIEEKLESPETKWTDFFTQIAERAPKEKYSNLGKTQIKLNGENIEAKVYELKLSAEEIQQICYQEINGDFKKINLSQIIYVYQEKLVKLEITMDIYDSSNTKNERIQIVKTFEGQNDNLILQIDNKTNDFDVMNIILEVTKSENDKYSINLGMTSGDVEISTDISIDIKFDANITTTELTDNNSVVINNKSSEEIKQIIETAVKFIREREGIEDTIIGILYDEFEIGGQIFKNSSEDIEKAAQQTKNIEEQLSQESVGNVNIRPY